MLSLIWRNVSISWLETKGLQNPRKRTTKSSGRNNNPVSTVSRIQTLRTLFCSLSCNLNVKEMTTGLWRPEQLRIYFSKHRFNYLVCYCRFHQVHKEVCQSSEAGKGQTGRNFFDWVEQDPALPMLKWRFASNFLPCSCVVVQVNFGHISKQIKCCMS